jgi:hypothetical protein
VDVRIVRVVVFGREVGIHGRSYRRSGDAEENAAFYVVFLECFVCKAWETLFRISQSSFALRLNVPNFTSLFDR